MRPLGRSYGSASGPPSSQPPSARWSSLGGPSRSSRPGLREERTMEIEWEDPPALALAKVRTPGRYVDWAYALRDQPGRWAKLPAQASGEERTEKGAANLAQSIRRGTTAGFA